jgi:hypothetical protein
MTKAQIKAKALEREQRMKRLVRLAIDKYDPDDLLMLMHECCTPVQREHLKDKVVKIATEEGYTVINIQGKDKHSQLIDYIETTLYPLYNDQQTVIL